MCGIFGIIDDYISNEQLDILSSHARQRGRDSSGLIFIEEDKYKVTRADEDINKLLKKNNRTFTKVIAGHSRLITNSMSENQPVVRDDMILIHNGIIVNHEEIWNEISLDREGEIDSEVILAVAAEHMQSGNSFDSVGKAIMDKCIGTMSCAIFKPDIGKVILFSNNGSLYFGKIENKILFASEEFALKECGLELIKNLNNESFVTGIPQGQTIKCLDEEIKRLDLIPKFKSSKEEESLLIDPSYDLKRCKKCILPETMPYITFNDDGVCNYCTNYSLRNVPKPKEELFNLIEPYRRKGEADCIVPFSGGRDSCYGLHLIVNELKMKPITYTYDWGMVTDLGRRNISRMCSELGVENIIVAADISKKRKNIAKNLKAWLKSPDLGMVSILTAGDKHFFRHVETVKKQTGINLNLWGVNPLEVTHFKAGFLGVKPDFEGKHVYRNGVLKQLDYQSLRFKAMLKSPGYFNTSIWDTLSGEYYRSFTKKDDYYHIFDYWRWDEALIDNTLKDYDWELANDTNTTWRIGDGTAAFYNYVYYLFAGFTEHDTFRSNQIREGQLTRESALELVKDENRPRYENIKWYLDTLNMDYKDTIRRVNSFYNNQNTYVK